MLLFLVVALLQMSSANPVMCVNELLNLTTAEKLAHIAMEGLERKFPYNQVNVVNSEADVLPHYVLNPAFYGCYDWHSAVHSTWQLCRLVRTYPNASFVPEARRVLGRLFSKENLLQETEYFQGEGRGGFERPYGLAWLLQLVAELVEWNDTEGNIWRTNLVPLEAQAVSVLSTWLPKLTHPIRIGEHSQTAFAFGLVLDYARTVGDAAFLELLTERTRTFYLGDRDGPLAYEPSGHDFLSPCWGEADLVRRVLEPGDFSRWLEDFLPTIPTDPTSAPEWLSPVTASDPSDGKLAHFDGLNLSRAWMLEGVKEGLPPSDQRRASLAVLVEEHRAAGMKTVLGDMDYMGSHWLGSFAVYLSTCRGISL